jgi:hypothetical protein
MKSTLAAYYERKRRLLGDEFPGYYDPGIRKIFTQLAGRPPAQSASQFLRRYRRYFVNSIAHWTGQRKYDIDKLVRKLAHRCDALSLHLQKPESETAVDTAAFLTAIMANVKRLDGRLHS